MEIDLNRGVQIRRHHTGLSVYMYEDTPGVYLTAHGDEVDVKLAKECGFPTEEFAKLKLRNERVAAAMADIDRTLGSAADRGAVVKESGDYKVVDIGLGRFNIVGEDGVALNTKPMTRPEADIMLDRLTPAAK